MSKSDDSIRRLVDAKIDSVHEVVRMARVPFAVGTTIAIVWLTALYSHHLGYANNVVSGYESALMNDDGSICRSPLIERFHEPLFGSEQGMLCRKILEIEHEQWIQQRAKDNFVDILDIRTRTTVFDLGVVGNLTLLIVGLWFALATRRESHALASIVSTGERRKGSQHDDPKPKSSGTYYLYPQERTWSRADYVEAQQRIAHRFLFLSSTGPKGLTAASIAVAMLPAIVSVLHAGSDLHSVIAYSVQGVWIRLLTSIGSMFFILALYIWAARNLMTVAGLLDGWHLLCREYIDDDSGNTQVIGATIHPGVKAHLTVPPPA